MSSIYNMMGMMQGFNPLSISPTLFINPYVDPYVTTVDNNGLRQRGNIIDSATATTGQSLANAGTLASKCVNNGEGWYFESGAEMTTGINSSYNFLHDGSNFDIWVTVFVCPTPSTTYNRGFLTNNGFTNNNRGILLRVNSVAGNNSLEFRCGNNLASFISLTASGAITPNATNIIRITRNGSNARMYVNGTQVATQTISLSPGVGDASSVMTVAPKATASANIYLKDVVIFNRALTASEITAMNRRRFRSITPTPINTYLLWGDSNTAGRGDNPSIAGDLVGEIPGTYIPLLNTALDSSIWLGKLSVNVNATIPSENLGSQHGAEMRFGKSMGAASDTFLIKYGIGSIPMYQRASGDWNAATVGSYYSKYINNVIPQALNDLVHVYRRYPVFRGITPTCGANDAFVGGTAVSWVRAATLITVTQTNHGMLTGHKIPVVNGTDLTAIPAAIYQITRIDNNTFTFVGVNAGGTSGTLDYSAGSTYKANVTAVINGIIDTLGTITNQVTGLAGYTVNKLRLFFPVTRSGGVNFQPISYNAVTAAQVDMGTNYLTDNPTYTSKILGTHSESTEALAVVDTVHYTTAGYDTLGQREADYFLPFNNE